MASVTFSLPALPTEITRLLASRIDFLARTDSTRVYASIPKYDDPKDGFRDVTYAELAKAIDRASWWLDSRLARSHGEFECFAYFGPRDLRYVAMIIAGIKTGRKALLPSPSLSIDGLAHILSSSKCQSLAFGRPLLKCSWLEGLGERHPNIQLLEIPNSSDWFSGSVDDATPYTYEKTWDAAIDNPIFALHTSGTTGLPKLITYRNSTLVSFDSQYQLGSSGQSLLVNQFEGKRVWNSLSMAHLGGIYTNIIHPVYFHTIPVLGPPTATLNAELSDEMILHGSIASGFYPPFLLDEIVSKPESLQNVFDHLETIQYGTAPLNMITARVLTSKLNVQSHYASTELPFPPYFPLGPEDWDYLSFHPFAGIEFCHRYNDMFELLVVRKKEYTDYQPVFTTMPNASHFYTKDLWTPHPTKPGLWKYRGRSDDVIVLSDGNNIHVSAIESAIQEHPRICAALIGGQGRMGPFLIVEPMDSLQFQDDTSRSSTDFLDELWPAIQAISERLINSERIRITKERVIIAPSTRPFTRTIKGSLDRNSIIKDFEQDIERCYIRDR